MYICSASSCRGKMQRDARCRKRLVWTGNVYCQAKQPACFEPIFQGKSICLSLAAPPSLFSSVVSQDLATFQDFLRTRGKNNSALMLIFCLFRRLAPAYANLVFACFLGSRPDLAFGSRSQPARIPFLAATRCTAASSGTAPCAPSRTAWRLRRGDRFV